MGQMSCRIAHVSSRFPVMLEVFINIGEMLVLQRAEVDVRVYGTPNDKLTGVSRS